MKDNCENMLVLFPARVYYVSVRNKCSNFLVSYICSSTVEKNLGDKAFHTLIFLF